MITNAFSLDGVSIFDFLAELSPGLIKLEGVTVSTLKLLNGLGGFSTPQLYRDLSMIECGKGAHPLLRPHRGRGEVHKLYHSI